MDKERRANEKLKRQFSKFLRTVESKQNGLAKEVDGTRIYFLDIVEKYAKEDGTIDDKKLRKILREIENQDDYIYDIINDEMESTIEESMNKAKRDVFTSLGVMAAGIVGGKVIFDKIKKDALTGIGKDGNTLNKRIEKYTGNMLDEVRKAIRTGVLSGKTSGQINRDIKKAMEKESWKLKRLVGTELPNVYRRTVAELAKEGKNIKAVRIIDLRGRHPYHKKHECYRLAEQNVYGWGKGVYRPDDTYIYDPHPNCTAYFEYVFKGGDERSNEK